MALPTSPVIRIISRSASNDFVFWPSHPHSGPNMATASRSQLKHLLGWSYIVDVNVSARLQHQRANNNTTIHTMAKPRTFHFFAACFAIIHKDNTKITTDNNDLCTGLKLCRIVKDYAELCIIVKKFFQLGIGDVPIDNRENQKLCNLPPPSKIFLKKSR